jgi:NADP-dependent 3-hydroxy acid dehydrogenase YdfG
MAKDKLLLDKVALITGAGSGIGAATATLFASEGAKVIITGDNEDNIKKVTEEIKNNDGIANYAILDISNESAWKKVVEEAILLYGKIDILVNNAGIPAIFFSLLKTELQMNFHGFFPLML